MMRVVLLSLTMLWAIPADAESPVVATLEVKPKLCVVTRRTPTCELDLKLTWVALELGDHCIRAGDEEPPLACWLQTLQGQLEARRTIAQTLHLQLERGSPEVVIASAKVDVLKKESGDRRRRRRTRYVWDVL